MATTSASVLDTIRIQKLNSDNWHSWKFKMQMVLEEKDLWELVDGTQMQPESEGDLDSLSRDKLVEYQQQLQSWEKKDRKARATIILGVEDSQLGHVKGAETAEDAWKKLCGVYENRGLANRLFLRRKFFTATWEHGESMLQMVNRIKDMAEQLAAIGAPVSEEDTVMTILSALPETYSTVVIALESRNMSDLTLDFVSARLVHEDLKHKDLGNVNGINSALATNSSRQQQNQNNDTADRIADIKSRTKCRKCGKKGHWAKECRSNGGNTDWRGNGRNQANNARKQVFTTSNTPKKPPNTLIRSDWLIDSGASQHYAQNREDFTEYNLIKQQKVYLGDDTHLEVAGQGVIELDVWNGAEWKRTEISDCLHVPGLAKNLLAVSKLTEHNLSTRFLKDSCEISHKNAVLGLGVREGNLYKLVCRTPAANKVNNISISNKLTLWHLRLAHLNYAAVQTTQKHVEGMNDKLGDCEKVFCEDCIAGKQHREQFPRKQQEVKEDVLHTISSDVWGPTRTPTRGGNRYFVGFKDKTSRYRRSYLMKGKDSNTILKHFKEFKAWAENATGKKIKILRTDNGGEYTSKSFQGFLKATGITHQTTAPYTPEHNALSERDNRTLAEATRCLLNQSGLQHEFWGEALIFAEYVRNRSYNSAINSTPYEKFFGQKPRVDHLRTFGCTAYALIPTQQRQGKLASKTQKCIMLGFVENSKCYRLWNSLTQRIVNARDVVFNETAFLGQVQVPGVEGGKDEVVEYGTGAEVGKCTGEEDSNSKWSMEQPHEEEQQPHQTTPSKVNPTQLERSDSESEQETTFHTPTPAIRTLRPRKPPSQWWKVNQANVVQEEQEPQNYHQAATSAHYGKWEKAMLEELEMLQRNDTWQLVKLPKDRKPVGSKWVYKIKRGPNGEIERYKARLVAQGFSQQSGIDYNETFAPVAGLGSLRTILALCAQYGLEVAQMDVKGAYLNGELEEEIYMRQAEGFEVEGKEDWVYKLQKSLYGLKQSGRAWYLKLHNFLQQLNFKRLHSDNSIYVLQQKDSITILAVYVDDLILASNNREALNHTKSKLKESFEMTDLGKLSWFLGMEINVNNNNNTVTLNQKSYIENILKRYGMSDCKPVSTPMETNNQLQQDPDGQEFEDPQMYRQAVGSLMYAMVASRPDIAFAVGAVSKFNNSPQTAHWNAVKRIFRYLQGTRNYQLVYRKLDEPLQGFCDADWANDKVDRRSTTGYTFCLANAAITWKSQKQPTVALSSTEAEYMAASHATREAIWLRRFLDELGFQQTAPTLIYSDNQGCIAMSKNPVHHQRTKHIDIQHHFVRDEVNNNTVTFKYLPTNEMPADVFTKAISKDAHERHCKKLGLSKDENTSPSGSINI
jgi:hypothetical protein